MKNQSWVHEETKTFAALAQEYIPYAEINKATSTTHRDKNRLQYLLEAFGKKKLAEITVQDVEQYKQNRRKVVKPATVNRELALFRHMLSKAMDWEYLNKTPTRTVKLFKEPSGRIRYLSNGERERLLQECRCSDNSILYPTVLTALNTGMRKGELQGLTWDDVDFERRIITIRQTKNNEIRHIPIARGLLQVLQALLNEYPHSYYVFSKPNGTAYGDWKKSFRAACRRAGVKDFRFHDLRHTFASYLGMSGCNAFEIKALTGHKTLAMVDRYVHISNDQLKVAVERIGVRMMQTTLRL